MAAIEADLIEAEYMMVILDSEISLDDINASTPIINACHGLTSWNSSYQRSITENQWNFLLTRGFISLGKSVSILNLNSMNCYTIYRVDE